MSAKDALHRYYERQMRKIKRDSRPRRKNAKPEREVQKAVLAWLRENGFSINVIESKAVYSAAAGRYVNGQTAPGVADLFGCAPEGTGVFIELKAPGRRSTLRPGQRSFLMDKINAGAFAVCVDSVDCLRDVWEAFAHRRKIEPQLAKTYLMRHLPQEAPQNDELDL